MLMEVAVYSRILLQSVEDAHKAQSGLDGSRPSVDNREGQNLAFP
jgi:hypothetical protein